MRSDMRPSGSSTTNPRHHGAARLLLAALVCAGAFTPASAQQGVTLAGAEREHALIQAAAASSPELHALRVGADAARARALATGFAAPVVLSGEIEDVPDGYDFGSAAVRLEFARDFLTGGRSAAARALAATEVQSAEAALAGAEGRLTAAVLRHLARVRAATAAARRLAAEDSLLIAAEASLRDRFGVGEARYVDVLRLRTERLRVQADRAGAVAEARVARETLLGIAGPEGARELVVLLDAALVAAAAASLDDSLPAPPAIDSLLALSPEVRLARAAVGQATAGHALIVAEQRPRIAASVGAQRMIGGDGANSFGPVIGASVTLPFTARRANAAASLAAQTEVRSAAATLEATRSRVRAELAGALARYEAARERIAVYDAALLRGAREERESALAAYRTGEMSLIELLDFERALTRAELERLRARADAAEAYADLITAASGGR